MSSSPDEAPSLSKLISCLLLNLGTITEAQITTQKIAGAAANLNGKVVVFDPVGVGATEYRKKSASGELPRELFSTLDKEFKSFPRPHFSLQICSMPVTSRSSRETLVSDLLDSVLSTMTRLNHAESSGFT